jgi:hypothetical protein
MNKRVSEPQDRTLLCYFEIEWPWQQLTLETQGGDMEEPKPEVNDKTLRLAELVYQARLREIEKENCRETDGETEEPERQ